ncbi:MAG: MoxR family ATPase [Alphaproteobacteria bacterium]
MDVNGVRDLAGRIRAEVAKAVIGQDETVSLLLTALFARGHILLEGVPGVAKTLLARAFARAIGLGVGRIQFTPDLMPGDIIGSNLFDFRSNAFSLVKGPIFNEVILADEINRTPPKTQAALLEAMQERSVTIDGKKHDLSPWFLVVATQNPIEQQGTYQLPEAQLDRFLFKHVLDYPSEAEELRIVATYGARTGMADPAAMGVAQVGAPDTLDAAAAAVASVRMSDEIAAYIVALVRGTRISADLTTGASPRAGAMLAAASRARAALDGRDFVIPDDVKSLAGPALRHRCVLSPGAEVEGRTTDQALAAVIDRIEAPR